MRLNAIHKFSQLTLIIPHWDLAERDDVFVVCRRFEADRRRCHVPLPTDADPHAGPASRQQRRRGHTRANVEVDFILTSAHLQ